MGRLFEVTNHAVERWLERVSNTVDPRRVPALIRRAWESNRVVTLGVDPAGREICQVGDLLLLVYRSNRKTVIVTVFGKTDEVAASQLDALPDARARLKWRRTQRLQTLGQMHRANWQIRKE